MHEREEKAQFSLISYSKEHRFRVSQTLPDSWKNKKLLQVLTWFLKLVYYRDYLGKIWRNSKIHDCQPIFQNCRHWLLAILCSPQSGLQNQQSLRVIDWWMRQLETTVMMRISTQQSSFGDLGVFECRALDIWMKASKAFSIIFRVQEEENWMKTTSTTLTPQQIKNFWQWTSRRNP